MFKNEIFLKECKRLKSEEDKLKLKNIKDDIFINKLPYKIIIENISILLMSLKYVIITLLMKIKLVSLCLVKSVNYQTKKKYQIQDYQH